MTIPFIIGAYASHPAPELQEDYYKLLAQQPWINGLEMPYPGQIATDNELLAGLLSADWDFNTITAIPGTMQNVGKDANFGLASPDRDGREAALAFTRASRCTRLPREPPKGMPSGVHWKFYANGTGTVRSS